MTITRRKLKAMYMATDAWRPDDRLSIRARRAAKIRKLAEGGKIAIVVSGMDCDGSAWRGRVCKVAAIPSVVEQWLESYYDGAEGPQSHELARLSDVEDVEEENRDLALEAFEDGHPHVLHY